VKPLARLPGIYVDRVDPPAPEGLPRMDVAVFIGLAASGPVHRAIALESVAAFEAVFGGDVPLAFDPARGETIVSNLARSVRAFFSNGGRRCWVVRVAMTADLADLWGAAGGGATRSSFALSGILARAPTSGGAGSTVRPALLAARSLGSWADETSLSARVLRESVTIDAPKALAARGFTFADRSGLAAGDMLELAARNGSSVRYAKVVRVDSGTVWALWIAGFTPLDTTGAIEAGQAQVAGDSRLYDATLTEGGETSLTITEAVASSPLVLGRWVKFERQGKADWLMIDRIDPKDRKTALGRAWRQVGSHMPQGDFAARRCTLEIAENAGDARSSTAGIGLAREHPAAIQAVLDDDLFYAPADSRAAARRAAFALTEAERVRLAAATPRPEAISLFGSADFTAADRVALRTGWLPLGLGAAFGEPARAIHSGADALTRDGLDSIDERLFLDPRLASLTLTGLAAEAERLRDLEEEQLFGIHVAIDIPSDLYSPASLIAVPDAGQPAIAPAADRHQPPAPKPGEPNLPRWTNHLDGCPPSPPAGALTGPDWSRFLDGETEVLATPVLVDPPTSSPDGNYAIEWQADVAGTVYVLEEAARFDFADAAEVLRAANDTSFAATSRAEGTYYYRLHVERAGNTSQYAACRVVVRKTGMVVVADDADTIGERLRRVQVPLLRLCAATQDFFALLSLPRDFRAAEAGDHARALAQLAPGFGGTDTLGAAESRALSYGALYHPWLATQQDQGLSATAPDGAIAGLYARRATARGAWIAPANDALADILGLDPAIPQGDLAGLDAAQVNVIRRLPAGFTVLDEDTLSEDADWRQVHVRRLMMLIRRAALRRGFTYVFEPNGDVTRRAVERSFSTMLDDLETRGAFASGQPGGAWRVQLPEAANDRDEGRLTVEIAVAPANALRTLILRLTQIGNRLTIGEVA
jgi:phage tail sheath protein FI